MIRVSRTFWFALASIALLAFGLRVWLALHAWFVTDDFYFLNWVQSRHWSLSEVFLPTRPRGIEVYRPLGLDLYFYANFAAFGWNAFGYYVSGILLQTAAAAVVYRIARQEKYDPRMCWVAAAITWIGGPSLTKTYAVAEHNYLCVMLFYALSVSLFLDYLRSPRARFQVGSCAALLLGLWSNDMAVTIAPLVVLLAFSRATGPDLKTRASIALSRSWPQLLTTALFCDFRISAVQLRQRNWFYEPDFGFDMISNTIGNLAHAAGGGFRLGVVLSLTTAALLLLGRERMRGMTLGFAWLFLAVAPFAVLAFPTSRFGLGVLPALALSVAAIGSALVPKLSRPGLQSAAAIGLVVLCVPWEAALDRAIHPRAPLQRDAYTVLQSTLPADDRSCVTVLCGGEGLGTTADCAELRKVSFGGELFRAVVPDRPLSIDFDDSRIRLSDFVGHDCVTYELRDDRRLVLSSSDVRPREVLSQLH